jgi:hypothetical protein
MAALRLSARPRPLSVVLFYTCKQRCKNAKQRERVQEILSCKIVPELRYANTGLFAKVPRRRV